MGLLDADNQHTRADSQAQAPDTALQCPYCGQPFPRSQLLTLHLGLEHEPRLTASERAAFEQAYQAETDDLRLFRLKLLLVLIVIYFGLLFVYAVIT